MMKLHRFGLLFLILPVYSLNYATGFTSSPKILLKWLQSNLTVLAEPSDSSTNQFLGLPHKNDSLEHHQSTLQKNRARAKNRSQSALKTHNTLSNQHQAPHTVKNDDKDAASKESKTHSLYSQSSIELNKDVLEIIFSPYYSKDQPLKDYIKHFDCAAYTFYEMDGCTVLCTDDVNKLPEYHHSLPFPEYIVEGTTVLDIGLFDRMQMLTLSKLIGSSGFIHAFEPDVKRFCEAAIDLYFNQCSHVLLHRAHIGKDEPSNDLDPYKAKIANLDDFQFKNLSLVVINQGNDAFFNSGKETFLLSQPFVILNDTPLKDLEGYLQIDAEGNSALFAPVH